MSLSQEQMVDMFTNMVKIRMFEEKVSELFAAGKIPGFVHLYIGEEAVATGVCANLNKSDFITSTHRGHGHLISKGGDLKLMMAELFGKKTGYCKGKGGSMHIADVDLGILGRQWNRGRRASSGRRRGHGLPVQRPERRGRLLFRRRRLQPGHDPRSHESGFLLEIAGCVCQ